MKTVRNSIDVIVAASIGTITATVLIAAAVSGWAKSTTFTTVAPKVESPSQVGSMLGSGPYELPLLW